MLKILIRTIDWSVELQDKPGETLPALVVLALLFIVTGPTYTDSLCI